jgi:hypothetical protein
LRDVREAIGLADAPLDAGARLQISATAGNSASRRSRRQITAWGLKLDRVVLPPAKVQIVPPKSRDQEFRDRRQWRQR